MYNLREIRVNKPSGNTALEKNMRVKAQLGYSCLDDIKHLEYSARLETECGRNATAMSGFSVVLSPHHDRR